MVKIKTTVNDGPAINVAAGIAQCWEEAVDNSAWDEGTELVDV